jgi:hypothetical protein
VTRVLIGFSTTSAPLSRAIRWLTRAEVSHAWFLTVDPVFGVPMVWEAGLRGFLPYPARAFWARNRVVEVVEVPGGDWERALPLMGTWLGRQYDVRGLLGGLVVLAGRWLRRKWRNPSVGAGHLFCSEVVAHLLQLAKVPGAAELCPDEVTPQELRQFLHRCGTGIMREPVSPEAALEGVVHGALACGDDGGAPAAPGGG